MPRRRHTTTPREKLDYKETYVKPGRKVYPDAHPTCPWMPEGTEILEVYIREAARVIRGGDEIEYQDVRIYIKPPAGWYNQPGDRTHSDHAPVDHTRGRK